MIIAIIDASASTEKRTEVLQTLASVTLMNRRDQGCVRCRFCEDIEDETALTLIEEWRSREVLDEHLQSPVFGVLLGLKPLPKRPPGMRICTVASEAGRKAVSRARGHAAATSGDAAT